MTTKRELINQALEEIGLASYVFDATPEELQGFLRRLNGMAAEWDGLGIRVGYNFGNDIDAEAGIPDTAVNCFATNLGLRMAPAFGKTVAMETKVAATNALNAMMVARRVMPQVPFPGRLPVGTGSRQSVMDPQYFLPGDEVTGLNDGPVNY